MAARQSLRRHKAAQVRRNPTAGRRTQDPRDWRRRQRSLPGVCKDQNDRADGIAIPSTMAPCMFGPPLPLACMLGTSHTCLVLTYRSVYAMTYRLCFFGSEKVDDCALFLGLFLSFVCVGGRLALAVSTPLLLAARPRVPPLLFNLRRPRPPRLAVSGPKRERSTTAGGRHASMNIQPQMYACPARKQKVGPHKNPEGPHFGTLKTNRKGLWRDTPGSRWNCTLKSTYILERHSGPPVLSK